MLWVCFRPEVAFLGIPIPDRWFFYPKKYRKQNPESPGSGFFSKISKMPWKFLGIFRDWDLRHLSINLMGFKEALAEVDCFQPFVEPYNLLTTAWVPFGAKNFTVTQAYFVYFYVSSLLASQQSLCFERSFLHEHWSGFSKNVSGKNGQNVRIYLISTGAYCFRTDLLACKLLYL